MMCLIFALVLASCLPQAGTGTDSSTPSIPPATSPAWSAQYLSIRQYGAVGDGKTKDTRAIQSAIDAAGAQGGGTVWFSPGRYLSGGLLLKSGVTLRIDAGATLLGSTELSDYLTVASAFRSRTNSPHAWPSLIYGESLHDLAIVGEGVIDGQGAAFTYGPDRIRPYVLRFVTCQRVRVEGITLRDSAGWMQHYLACDDLAIHGIRVYSHANYNNDMMDIDCCRNVRISDCIGDTGDDAVTLKSTANRACDNVTITNCVLSSHCNAIKCGTESNGGFKNIAISNCVVSPSQSKEMRHGLPGGLAGIALEIVDGGTLDGLTISNIAISGVKAPLFLRLGNRARPATQGEPVPGTGTFKNVVISNVVATDAGDIGCAVAGLPGHPIENVTLSNVKLRFAGGSPSGHASAAVPEKLESSPECTMFDALPAYGFYCRHVNGLTLDKVDVRCASPDPRSALICDDVRDVHVDGLSAQSATGRAPVIILNDVHRAILHGCTAPSARVFLRMQGETDKVSVMANDLSAVAVPFEFAAQTPAKSLYQSSNRLKAE